MTAIDAFHAFSPFSPCQIVDKMVEIVYTVI